ncbi:MAG: hypothetical protein OXU66_15950 [Gammaproteobacteria bacterium]|nr:hypothetical protein [Gammaproteobacteria bacterium]
MIELIAALYHGVYSQLIRLLSTMYSQLIREFVEQETLPASYVEDAAEFVVPLTELIAKQIIAANECLVIGINGAQGTGKTTLAKLCTKLLEARKFRIANLSIDDFYLTKSERLQLATDRHQLLGTRGVPGTHDVRLLLDKLSELKILKSAGSCEVPRFNKASDDRLGQNDWQCISGPVDAIILEGWFVGVPPQEIADLQQAINSLEEDEDTDGQWREYVNSQLAGLYQQVFKQFSSLVMLQAPSFEQVFTWRALQEEKLQRTTSTNVSKIMNSEQLHRFIQHYERLTRHCLDVLPSQANIVFELGSDHRFKNVSGMNS